ncbi:MAG: class I tRNA ligase family protein, partial [Nocardioidaceae bacterium]|nr:class I tRNA ligase family protein [Nocardioidaceae bacterium]
MRAWTSPDVPRLDDLGVAEPVRVHDSSTHAVELTDPDGPARLYVCGITPYDATHLGHAATYVAFDLLIRAWRDAGHEVRYVQNVTDVDDPLLERATATGVDWAELAQRETELFREDMTALRVLPPDAFVGAVESIPLVP